MTTPEQELAAKYLAEDRLLDAARELKKLNKDNLTSEDIKAIERAERCEATLAKPDLEHPTWNYVGESKKNGIEIRTWSKIQLKATPVKVGLRMEAVVEKSLVPYMFMVVNEINLIPTWVPSWRAPRMKVVRAETLERSGLANQTMMCKIEAPLQVLDTYSNLASVDDSNNATRKAFILHADPLDDNDHDLVPPSEEGVVRAMFNGSFSIEKCPEDRADEAKKLRGKLLKEDEDFMICTILFERAKPDHNGKEPGYIVKKILRFIFRTIAGTVFNTLIGIGVEIRDGKRPEYTKAREERAELYDRIDAIIEKIAE